METCERLYDNNLWGRTGSYICVAIALPFRVHIFAGAYNAQRLSLQTKTKHFNAYYYIGPNLTKEYMQP